MSGFPLYTLTVVAAALAAYLPGGYRANASRFTHEQYGYDRVHAWFYTIGQYTNYRKPSRRNWVFRAFLKTG